MQSDAQLKEATDLVRSADADKIDDPLLAALVRLEQARICDLDVAVAALR